ncbi:MAG: GAF domain-containing protein [Dehalococcoidia bacterium]|nr:GAF domain-containing protein [Dehalococcoidia bacterium]
MRSIPLRLGPKLNLSLLLFIVVLGTATAALVFFGFNRTQDNAAQTSRQGLEREGVRTLLTNAETQAYIGQLQFFPAVEWGHQAARYMAVAPYESTVALPEVPALAPDDAGNHHDVRAVRITDLFVPAGAPLDQSTRDLQESAPLDTLFPSLMADFPGRLTEDNFRPIAVYYIGPSGALRYYPATGEMQRTAAGLSSAISGDLSDLAGPAGNPERATIWTTPYRDETRKSLVVTAYTPVYVANEYRGAIGVDLSIERLIDQINLVRPTPTGFAFYIDGDGQFLQTLAYDLVTMAREDPNNAAFHQVIEEMLAGQSDVARVRLGSREMFVAYAPLSDVGGSFAMAAPVDEITREAASVADSINDEANRTVGVILLTMLFLFVVALGGTAWLNRRVFLQPIDALVSGTRAVAAGNFNASIPVRSNDELGDLAASFNRMIDEVRTRNEALQREIAERERTTIALAEREEGFRNIFESTSDALFITRLDDQHIVDANPAALEMYGYSLDELRELEPFALVHPRSRPYVDDYVATTQAGQTYRSRALELRKDGSSFIAEVLGTTITFHSQPHILTVVRDVSEEAEQQRLLEQRVEERTRELRALLHVSSNVSSTLDLGELLGLVLDQVSDVIPYTGASMLVIEGDQLVVREARGPESTRGPANPAIQKFSAEGLNTFWRALLDREPIIVDDVRGDDYYAQHFRGAVGEALDSSFSRIVSWLALPMVQKGRFVGMIALSSDKRAAFTRREADLGMAIANQAAVAIENASLFAEAERRASETTALSRVATSLDLERSVKSTLDNLAQRMVESTGAVGCSVSTLTEDGLLLLGGTYGLPEGFLEAVAAGHHRGAPRPNQVALQSGGPYILRHLRSRTLAEPLYTELHDVVRDEPWDTLVIVPMRFGERDLGTIENYYLPGAEPDDREISLITAMARQAATAIENALLFAQTEKRVRQLEALTRIAASFTLESSIEQLMNDIAGEVLTATSAVSATITVTGEHAIRPLRIVGVAGQSQEFVDAMQDAYAAGAASSAEVAIGERRPVFLPNMRAERLDDPRYAPARRLFEDADWDSVLVVPIIYGDRPLGVLTVAYAGIESPGQEETGFIEAIADQTALAIENARLYQRASAAAALEERQRLARELHDSVSQALYGIALGARTARRRVGDDGPANVVEPLDYVLSLAEAGLTEMRALIFELRPESIATEGLVAAIGRQVAATQARYGITVEADLCDEPDIAIEAKEAVYRIAQESLHNTVKHARATRVQLSLACDDSAIRLRIRDNGQGFDPSGDFPGHLGLRSMRERAQGIRGTFEIESSPGEGTTVTLTVPA